MGWVGAPRPAAPSRSFLSLLSLSPRTLGQLCPVPAAKGGDGQEGAVTGAARLHKIPDNRAAAARVGKEVWGREGGEGGVREREVGRQERGPRVRGAPPSPHRRSLSFPHTLYARIVPFKGGGPGAGPCPRLAEDGGDAGERQNLAPPGRGGLAPARRVAAAAGRGGRGGGRGLEQGAAGGGVQYGRCGRPGLGRCGGGGGVCICRGEKGQGVRGRGGGRQGGAGAADGGANPPGKTNGAGTRTTAISPS